METASLGKGGVSDPITGICKAGQLTPLFSNVHWLFLDGEIISDVCFLLYTFLCFLTFL